MKIENIEKATELGKELRRVTNLLEILKNYSIEQLMDGRHYEYPNMRTESYKESFTVREKYEQYFNSVKDFYLRKELNLKNQIEAL